MISAEDCLYRVGNVDAEEERSGRTGETGLDPPDWADRARIASFS